MSGITFDKSNRNSDIYIIARSIKNSLEFIFTNKVKRKLRLS